MRSGRHSPRPVARVVLLVLFALLAPSAPAAAVEPPAYEVAWRLTGEAMHLQTSAPSVSVPPAVGGPDRLTDNPLLHGAFWTALDLTVRSAGATVTATLLGEHRGASGGPYPRDDLQVLPSFHVVAERPLLPHADVHLGVETGKLSDYRPYCGLLIGNLEVDVFRAHARRGPWRLTVSNIADLGVGLDLGIDDGRDYILSLDDVDAGGGCRLDLRAGRFDYGRLQEPAVDPAEPARTGTTVAAVLRPGRGFGLEGEFSRRDRGPGAVVPDARNAWLARVRWSIEGDGAWLRLTAERRAYEAAFNDGFFAAHGPIYRWGQVYPLRNYHRPFAQWPVYAEYQGRTVRTWILGVDARAPLCAALAFVGQLDLNRLEAEGESAFTCPYYDLGLTWEAAPGLEFLVTGTDRAMNLDVGHQTLYLLKDPVVMLAARWGYAW